MPRPFVSVLIDTYNHEKFIEQAIMSVLEQNFPAADYEILVVDDGSTDGTAEIVKKFAPRVAYLPKQNGGQASAFNFGIPKCRGEIVAFLDGDDWWKANKLSAVSAAMNSDPAIGIVGNGITIVQADGTEEEEILLQGNRFRANTREGAKEFRVRGSFLGTSRMTIRASVLAEIGKVPEAIVFEADEYLFTLAAVLNDALILPDVLTHYRLHGANLYQISSADAERSRRKQKVLAALADSLEQRFGELKVNAGARRVIVNNVLADADFLRLSVDGGWPWETVRAEWFRYERVLDRASLAHRAFKLFTLLPAFVLPPRLYFRLKDRVIQSSGYQEKRRQWLPNPAADHVLRTNQHAESPPKSTFHSGS